MPEGSPRSSEFDDAVTTEISDVLASAFGEDQSADPSDVIVTDAQLTAHSDSVSEDILAPGLLLNNRFEIVDLVHRGGMSFVYKAVDHRRRPEGSGEIHVALKIMRSSIASDEEARLSLEREAAKAQSLSHPNIINIFDFDDHEGCFFLVMEWLEGESINEMLRRNEGKSLDPDFARAVIAGAAAGVQHAHQKNVVHADINPSNVFITEDMEIKLLDFGVARYTSNTEQETGDRFAWVTKPYASPEVLSGLAPVIEDDVFSLACVAYRLLGGKHPFGGALSLVAKHRGLQVEPIPVFSDIEWGFLRSALAYERADRPNGVRDLLPQQEAHAGHQESAEHPVGRAAPRKWMALAAAAAVIIAAGGLWLLQRGGTGETGVVLESTPMDTPSVAQSVDASVHSIVESLLTAANQALGDGQLVAPNDRNARTLFREALALEPDNAEALRGLRIISNDFVQQTHLSLNADNPLQAYEALSIARETDPSNPAIQIVGQLLDAKADGELADARLAIATGSFDLAAQILGRAEQYENVEPAAVQSLLRQIERGRQSNQLLARLATADAQIAAGRLLNPEGDNAHALLLDLHSQHGDDVRLLASMERLGERLLTRAAFAAAAERIAEAAELLGAVDALGVLAPEVEAARMSLGISDIVLSPEDGAPQVAEEATGGASPTGDLQLPQVAEEVEGAPSGTGNLRLPEAAEELDGAVSEAEGSALTQAAEQRTRTPIESEDLPAPQAAAEQVDETLLAASLGSQAIHEEPAEQPNAVADADPQTRRQSLQELGIIEYVAPVFPRFAERREISGVVEIGFTINADGGTGEVEIIESRPGRVFDTSAANAVRQWRFEPRDEALRAQITLRFDIAQ